MHRQAAACGRGCTPDVVFSCFAFPFFLALAPPIDRHWLDACGLGALFSPWRALTLGQQAWLFFFADDNRQVWVGVYFTWWVLRRHPAAAVAPVGPRGNLYRV